MQNFDNIFKKVTFDIVKARDKYIRDLIILHLSKKPETGSLILSLQKWDTLENDQKQIISFGLKYYYKISVISRLNILPATLPSTFNNIEIGKIDFSKEVALAVRGKVLKINPNWHLFK